MKNLFIAHFKHFPKCATMLLALFFSFGNMSAQTWLNPNLIGQKVPGWAVTTDGDTLHGQILYDHSARMCRKVIFWDDNNPEERQKLKGGDLKGFSYEGMYWESIEFNDGSLKLKKEQSEKMFVLELVKGKLSFYEYYVLSNSKLLEQEGNMIQVLPMDLDISNYLQKDGEMYNLNDIRFMNFRKGMSKLLSDCEPVAKKISDKEYGRKNLLDMIGAYNSACGG